MAEKHIKAEKDYVKGMKYKDIAEKYEVSLNTVKSWKKRYGWNRDRGAPPTKSVHPKKQGGQPGNINAKGNSGGAAPKANANAVKHGFFRKIFPTEEVADLAGEIMEKSPIDMLWENIIIQYTAIARAQSIMHVENNADHTKMLKRSKTSGSSSEKEYEIQFAWDKQANFMNAQSRAMTTFMGLVEKYDKLANTEEQKLRIEKLKKEISMMRTPTESTQSVDDWKSALQAKVERRRKLKESEGHE